MYVCTCFESDDLYTGARAHTQANVISLSCSYHVDGCVFVALMIVSSADSGARRGSSDSGSC